MPGLEMRLMSLSGLWHSRYTGEPRWEVVLCEHVVSCPEPLMADRRFKAPHVIAGFAEIGGRLVMLMAMPNWRRRGLTSASKRCAGQNMDASWTNHPNVPRADFARALAFKYSASGVLSDAGPSGGGTRNAPGSTCSTRCFVKTSNSSGPCWARSKDAASMECLQHQLAVVALQLKTLSGSA
jgi:hypothetical protein